MAKSKKAQTADETTNATSENIFGVLKEDSQVNEFTTEHVVELLKAKYTETQIAKLIESGAVMPTDDAIYSMDKAKLEALIVEKGWDKPQPATETSGEDLADELAASKETEDEIDLSDPNQPIYDLFESDEKFRSALSIKEGALVQSLKDGKKDVASLGKTDKATWEKVTAKYEGLQISKQLAESPDKTDDDGQEPIENFRKEPESESTALIKDDAIVGEVAPDWADPLTDEEKNIRVVSETAVREAKTVLDTAPQIMMEHLSVIRHGRLYRDTHGKDFGKYAFETFGITREYAQNMAQAGDFLAVLGDDANPQLTSSVNNVNRSLRGANKIAAAIGVKASEFEIMRPIIESTAEIFSEIAMDENGEMLENAPQIIVALNETIAEVARTGNVEIDGEQISIADAKEQGLLGGAVQLQVVTQVREQILAQKQTIIQDAKRRQASRTAPHVPVTPKKTDKEEFVGEIPTHFATCSAHGLEDNYVVKVFNAGFELKCGCKFQLLVGSDSFVCIETDGKTVRHD